jgi:anti-sigma regulatory factor (Ser/Thr protein kinase)
MPEIPNIRLRMSNELENVLVVEQVLAGVAASLALDALQASDLATAVGEACKNVVYHAYEGGQGPLELELYVLPGAVEVVVRDHGIGIRPHVGERRGPHTGIGMPIVHLLAQSVAYSNLEGGGTEVRMHFPMANALLPDAPAEDRPPPPPQGEDQPAGTIAMALAPGSLARAVLPRVVGAVAARAHFPAERVAALAALLERLAAGAGEPLGGAHLAAELADVPRGLEVRIGPLPSGLAAGLLDRASAESPGAAPEAHRVMLASSGELLVLSLLENG